MAEAVALAGDHFSRRLDETASTDGPVQAIDAFFALWRDRLLASGFRAGCPVVAVAVEANDDAPQLAGAAGRIFVQWRETLAGVLIRHGLPEARGRRLASFVLAAAEGAVVLCRAQQSIEPLDAAADEIHDLLVTALGND